MRLLLATLPLIIVSLTFLKFVNTESPALEANDVTADYYCFTNDRCSACTKQLPVVKQLNKDGYNFKIKKDEYKKYNITTVPSFVVIVRENGIPVVTVRMENRHWTAFQLKTLVRTVNFLIRMA